jgi:predicted phosphoribosyltransferase
MFRNRDDAGTQLAEKLKGRKFQRPLVLAIPQGGVVVGAILGRALGADLDVILSRKLRSPDDPHLAIGAVSEEGFVYLTPQSEDVVLAREGYLSKERAHQLNEIAWRRSEFRAGRPPAPVAGRSVIVTDDGVATGSTMMAAIQVIRAQHPAELLAAAPVIPADQLAELGSWCNEVVAVLTPRPFLALGHFYEDFTPVGEDQAARLLRAFASTRQSASDT